MARPRKRPDYNSSAWQTRMYNAIKNNLEDAGYVEEVDEHQVKLYISALANAFEALDIMDKEGKTFLGKDGVPRVHPAWKVYKESMGMVGTFSNALGLSAAARKKIGMAIENELDPAKIFGKK